MEILLDLTVIFTAAAVMMLIMDRYNHPTIPAYIIAGLLMGSLISIASDDLLNLAQIGVAFLVFVFGLKYNPGNLKSTAKTTLNTSLVQMLLTGGLGFMLGTLLGFNMNESLYLAIASALSSSLVGLQLTEREIHTNLLHGRLSESIHFVQDMVAFGLFAVVLSTTIESAVNAVIYSALILGTAILIRDYVFGFIADQAEGNQELLTMASLSLLIGFIGLTEIIGVSMVVGAFAAGISASKFPYNLELLDTMGSIKDFFSAIFFVVLGALVTLPSQQVLATATGLIIITAIAAPVITYFSLKVSGYDNRTALLTGLSLDQVSELALIIAIQGSIAGMITETVFEAIILAGAATMMLSSYTKKHEEDIYNAFPDNREERKSYDIEDHVIIVGHDVQGKKIVEALKEEETDFVVIDNDPEKVSELREKGFKAIYGDIMDELTWKEANHKKAKLIVSTVPSRKVSETILELETPKDKIVRAENTSEAAEMLKKGAIHVIIPGIAASEKLEEHIEGLIKDEKRREELRRENLLEFKKYLNS